MLDEDQLYDELLPLCKGLGVNLVDFRLQKTKFGTVCQVIIHSPAGIGTNECATAYRAIMPRLEVLLDVQDISLEVSSPGTDRKIRLPREYAFFVGRGFAIQKANGQVVKGLLAAIEQDALLIAYKQETLRVALGDIAKAKLDYSQEAT